MLNDFVTQTWFLSTGEAAGLAIGGAIAWEFVRALTLCMWARRTPKKPRGNSWTGGCW